MYTRGEQLYVPHYVTGMLNTYLLIYSVTKNLSALAPACSLATAALWGLTWNTGKFSVNLKFASWPGPGALPVILRLGIRSREPLTRIASTYPGRVVPGRLTESRSYIDHSVMITSNCARLTHKVALPKAQVFPVRRWNSKYFCTI